MSLIKILNDEVKKEGYISYERMAEICKENDYRIETGRRRLEGDESPNVRHVLARKERGGGEYTKGYKWVERAEGELPPPKGLQKRSDSYELTEEELIIHSTG